MWLDFFVSCTYAWQHCNCAPGWKQRFAEHCPAIFTTTRMSSFEVAYKAHDIVQSLARQIYLVVCMQDNHIVHLPCLGSELVCTVRFAGADRSRKEGRDMETIGLAAGSPSCGCRWCCASTAQVGEHGAAFGSLQAAPSCREGAGGQAQPCESKVAGHSDAAPCLLICIFVLYLKPLHVTVRARMLCLPHWEGRLN